LLFINNKLSEFLMLITEEEQHSVGTVQFQNSAITMHVLRAVEISFPVRPSGDAAEPSESPVTVEEWVAASRKRIVDLYDELKPQGLYREIDRNVLSLELLDCFGFPVELEAGRINTVSRSISIF